MLRVVLDTNVLVNADRGQGSYGKRLLDLVRQGELTAVTTRAVRRENESLVRQLVRDPELSTEIDEFLEMSQDVAPGAVDISLEDDEDLKLLTAAVGGGAKFLVTDDRHLLDVGDYEGVQVVTPKDFWQWWQKHQDDSGHTWAAWATDIFGR